MLHRLLTRLDPETAHDLALLGLRLAQRLPPVRSWMRRLYSVRSPRLEQEVLGRRFDNPLGLAAGYDKNAGVVDGLAALGFGFVEVGTVTPEPQPGNPGPRIFRFPAERSLQNALGFNNDGMRAVSLRLRAAYPYALPVGVNIGKNAGTPLDAAESDFEALLRGLGTLCDYLVINISSPNTPGLRDLQDPGRVEALLSLASELTDRPVLIKLSPDLDSGTAVALSRAAVGAGAAGVVLTNTTVDYSLLPGARTFGGLSGQVLRERSYRMLRVVAEELFGECVLISVGGVGSGAEAYRRLRAGASLVQLYTALVYEGPGLPGAIATGILEHLDRDGFESVSEAVGADLRS